MTAARGLLKAVRILAVSSALVSTGCFLFPSSGFHNQITLTGFVRSSADSSAIPGIEITIQGLQQSWYVSPHYSDATGWFDVHWTPLVDDSSGEYREWLVTVTDVDGDQNGAFQGADTIVVEEDPIHVSTHEFEVDFYLEPAGSS